MSLDEKLNWIELGIKTIPECEKIQQEYLKKRLANQINDTILIAQHPLSINFGLSKEQNKLSDSVESEIISKYGKINDETIQQYFTGKGIEFTKSNHGGGASVFAPGQYVFYTIIQIEEATKRPITQTDMSAVGDYVGRILNIMQDSLTTLGVNDVQIRATKQNPEEKKNRKDIWIDTDKSYKIGSKALKVEKGVSYHGFSLFATKKSIEPFHYVKACGYDPAEVGITSIEDQIGYEPKPEEIYTAVKAAVQKHLYK